MAGVYVTAGRSTWLGCSELIYIIPYIKEATYDRASSTSPPLIFGAEGRKAPHAPVIREFEMRDTPPRQR